MLTLIIRIHIKTKVGIDHKEAQRCGVQSLLHVSPSMLFVQCYNITTYHLERFPRGDTGNYLYSVRYSFNEIYAQTEFISCERRIYFCGQTGTETRKHAVLESGFVLCFLESFDLLQNVKLFSHCTNPNSTRSSLAFPINCLLS